MRSRSARGTGASAPRRRFRPPVAGAVLGVLLCLLAWFPSGAGIRHGAGGPGEAVAASALSDVTELVRRPFPLIVPLEYRWARAAAWLCALETARSGLPAGARIGLAASGLDDRAGLLALCARLHTLDHLTPEDSPELVVAVRLVPAPDASAAMVSAVREADLLAARRALILDLEREMLAVRRHWPASLAEARRRAVELEAAAARLEALWQALAAARAAPGGWFCAPEALPALERAAMGARENAAVWLLLAEAQMQRDLPQAAVDAPGVAVRLLALDGTAEPGVARLAGRARYVRALGHWRLGQPALAESDLDASLRATSSETAPQGEELARRLRARGAVRMLRRDVDGMCADFLAACGLGDCEGLAVARRRGYCRSGMPVGSGAQTADGAP